MRKDGYKLKKIDPMEKVGAYIMDRRTDAMNMLSIHIPVAPMKEYLNKKRKEGARLSHLSLILTAYLHTVAQYPELNRFVVNKKYYARNEMAVGMVVLKAGETTNGTMSKIYFDLSDNVFTVNEKINKYISENRENADDNKTEKIISALLSFPGLLRFGIPILKWMDKVGILPKSIIDASPFHMSLGISNLASIKTNHIYHHCYEFGTTSVFITIGTNCDMPKVVDGQVIHERCMPLGVVMDERICTGAYFAVAFRKFKHLLEHPELMENPPEKIVADPAL